MANLRQLRNLTLHPQGEREVLIAADAGCALNPAAEGALVGPGRDGLETAAVSLAELLTETAAEGSVALIGGHTGLWVRALELIWERGIARPQLAYFETERVHDAAGRFVFEPTALVVIENQDNRGEDKP